jgi:hypothetical protein
MPSTVTVDPLLIVAAPIVSVPGPLACTTLDTLVIVAPLIAGLKHAENISVSPWPKSRIS